MSELLLHACCGPCSTVAVPAWRERGVEPVAWFHNPNIQPAAEMERRRESMLSFAAAASVAVVDEARAPDPAAWDAWAATLASADPERRCAACLGLRLNAAAAAAARLGVGRFSTTLSVSPYQRHDLIAEAGRAAAERQGVDFVYLDLRPRFRDSYAASRELGLYRQAYCGCAAGKWEAWHRRRARRAAG
jgi:hypothetical protein